MPLDTPFNVPAKLRQQHASESVKQLDIFEAVSLHKGAGPNSSNGFVILSRTLGSEADVVFIDVDAVNPEGWMNQFDQTQTASPCSRPIPKH